MPFECLGDDGRVYIHQDNWRVWRDRQCQHYPRPPGRSRFDVEIAHPRNRLGDVPAERNPHSLGGFCRHTCFYSCRDWSSIFGVHTTEFSGHRMVVESGHHDPVWGERVRLMSTSGRLLDEPWGTNPPNRFAYFRGKYWRVTSLGPLQPWAPGEVYPLSNLAAPGAYHPDGIPPDLLYREVANPLFPPALDSVNDLDDLPAESTGRYRQDGGDPITLGVVRTSVWRHVSAVTGATDFISVASIALPESFVRTPDWATGTLQLSVGGGVEYRVCRVASGSGRDLVVHFRLLLPPAPRPVPRVGPLLGPRAVCDFCRVS